MVFLLRSTFRSHGRSAAVAVPGSKRNKGSPDRRARTCRSHGRQRSLCRNVEGGASAPEPYGGKKAGDQPPCLSRRTAKESTANHLRNCGTRRTAGRTTASLRAHATVPARAGNTHRGARTAAFMGETSVSETAGLYSNGAIFQARVARPVSGRRDTVRGRNADGLRAPRCIRGPSRH